MTIFSWTRGTLRIELILLSADGTYIPTCHELTRKSRTENRNQRNVLVSSQNKNSSKTVKPNSVYSTTSVLTTTKYIAFTVLFSQTSEVLTIEF